jgi:hypothetical protein
VLRSLLLIGCLSFALAACGPRPEAPAEGHRATPAQAPTSAPSIVTEGRLDGEFFISGPIREGGLIRDSTHFYVWVEGAPAAELYRRIPGLPVEYPCGDGHAWEKQGEALVCITDADSTSYRCYFAIDVAEERLEVGVSC